MLYVVYCCVPQLTGVNGSLGTDGCFIACTCRGMAVQRLSTLAQLKQICFMSGKSTALRNDDQQAGRHAPASASLT